MRRHRFAVVAKVASNERRSRNIAAPVLLAQKRRNILSAERPRIARNMMKTWPVSSGLFSNRRTAFAASKGRRRVSNAG
jgi:hypothetical protein